VSLGWPRREYHAWTPDAIDLVERAIDAHGGRSSWRTVESIRLPFVRATGALLAAKGYGHAFPAPREFEVRPHERVTIFHGYPDEAHRGRFADGSVSLEVAGGAGAPTSISRAHRRTLTGWAKYRRWSSLDALYFFGYALWHYHVVPFTLGDARLVRVISRRGAAAGIDVIFPPDVHTHCRRQQFYFGADGRIVRHDYVAEVIGSWACGAHFWEDVERVDGLLITRRRRVTARLGSRALRIPVLCVQFGTPLLESEHGRPSR